MHSDWDKSSAKQHLPERDQQEWYGAAFDVAPVGLVLLDAEHRVSMANRSFCATIGQAANEIVGRALSDLLHPNDANVLASRFEAMDAGHWDAFSVEVRLRGMEPPRWAIVSVAGVRRSQRSASCYVVQVQDVTAARAAERRLAVYAAELERSNQELEQLAYVVSHDLQAPLRTLRGYAELLLEEYGRKLDEQGRRWVAYMLSATDRMHVLIADLLKVARVQSHSSQMTPAELGPIVTRAWERIRYAYEGVNPEFVCEALPTVPVDEIQIEQVFQNLFDNALKYRNPEVTPRVEVRSERSGEFWRLSVRDNGIGLDMTHADRIFDIFQRLHPDHAYDGTGIGLAVCRKIVERHRGRIWVESQPGRGSTFCFTLPAAAWQEPDAPASAELQAAGN